MMARASAAAFWNTVSSTHTDEFLRGEVVVVQQHAPQARRLADAPRCGIAQQVFAKLRVSHSSIVAANAAQVTTVEAGRSRREASPRENLRAAFGSATVSG